MYVHVGDVRAPACMFGLTDTQMNALVRCEHHTHHTRFHTPIPPLNLMGANPLKVIIRPPPPPPPPPPSTYRYNLPTYITVHPAASPTANARRAEPSTHTHTHTHTHATPLCIPMHTHPNLPTPLCIQMHTPPPTHRRPTPGRPSRRRSSTRGTPAALLRDSAGCACGRKPCAPARANHSAAAGAKDMRGRWREKLLHWEREGRGREPQGGKE